MAPLPQPSTPTVIGASDARNSGLLRYFTGRPCLRGHVAERSVANGTCVACKAEAQRACYIAGEGEKRRAYSRAYNRANKAEIDAKAAARYRKNTAAAAKRRDDWRAANPEHVRLKAIVYGAARRARMASAEGRHGSADIQALRKKQKGRCAACLQFSKRLQVDHIMPLALGGTNWPSNLQLLCQPCNASKCAKHPIAFMQSRGALL